MNLSFNELCELVTALNQTDIAELTLKNPEFELTLRKPSALQGDVFVSSSASAASQPTLSPAPVQSTSVNSSASMNSVSIDYVSPLPPAVDPSLVEITSPMVGTFYRSPAPDEASFVEVGDRIQSGQTVCIIEAMKLMNELETEVSGEIVAILVENSEPVEFGQPLMRVRPSK